MDRELYLYCRFNIKARGQRLHHHVIVKSEEGIEKLIRFGNLNGVIYSLVSTRECYLSEKLIVLDPILQSLLFDGESLVSKLKRSSKQSINQENESN